MNLWVLRAGVAIIVLLVALGLIQMGYDRSWTGFGQVRVGGDVLPAKTLWDWLELLVIPVVLAVGGLWFNRQQRERELQIATRRTQEEALQAYLDKMSDMLIATPPLPYETPPSDEVRPPAGLRSVTAARARTLTVLKRLDGDGKGKAQVVKFLYESGLIRNPHPVVDLNGADLDGANLLGIAIGGIEIVDRNDAGIEVTGVEIWGIDNDREKAVFRGACLRNTYLRNACLVGVKLQGADLTHASLNEADLRGLAWKEPNCPRIWPGPT